MTKFRNKLLNEGSIGDRLMDMMEESIIIQSLVTLVLVVTCCVVWIGGKQVPSELIALTMAVIGFWFGQKGQFSGGKYNARTADRLADIMQAAKKSQED